MKTTTRILLAFVAMLLASRAQAQTYSLDWFTVDGGGGMSTGGLPVRGMQAGVYSVTGTIGQPDAGRMSGGNFALQGGFWGILAAVQTPDAPLLTIALNPQLSTVAVSWPAPAEGWRLERTNILTGVAGPWTPVPPPYQTNGPSLYFVEPTTAGNQFYRLHKP